MLLKNSFVPPQLSEQPATELAACDGLLRAAWETSFLEGPSMCSVACLLECNQCETCPESLCVSRKVFPPGEERAGAKCTVSPIL